MGRTKKLLNDPTEVVTELLDGLVLAADGGLVRLGDRTVVMRPEIPKGKVGLIIGGGSGHQPLFSGFVGENLADAAVCGNVFAAPSLDLIPDAVAAVNNGAGALFVYGNYSGDNMNFDIAAELAEEEDHTTRTVRVWTTWPRRRSSGSRIDAASPATSSSSKSPVRRRAS